MGFCGLQSSKGAKGSSLLLTFLYLLDTPLCNRRKVKSRLDPFALCFAKELMSSAPGYYIGVDTNPHRVLKSGETAKPDLTFEQLPGNPTPWSKGPPSELAMHVIPPEPQVFSPVIVWGGYWTTDSILKPHGVSWDFGGILGLMGPKKAFYGGTMYFLPGDKKISMTVNDSQGRSTTVTREFTVRAGRYAFAYWGVVFVLCVLIVLVVRKVRRKRKIKAS